MDDSQSSNQIRVGRVLGSDGVVSQSSSSQTLDTIVVSSLDSLENIRTPSVITKHILSGPKVLIHRFDVGIKLLQILLCLWFLSGIAFITCIFACLFVNFGYVSFTTKAEVTLIVISFTFYVIILFSFYRSLLRTFTRICIAVLKEKFGGGKKDFILLRWIDFLGDCICSCLSCSDPNKEFFVDIIKTIVLLTIVIGVVGIPLFYVAFNYGYWAIISVLCSVGTIGSGALLLVVNLGCRIFRALGYFLSILIDPDCNRVKASFLASHGNDHGRNIFNVFLERSLRTVFVIIVCTAVFSNGKMEGGGWILLFTIFLVCLILRLRCTCCFACCCRKRRLPRSGSSEELLKDEIKDENGDGIVYYDNSHYHSGKGWVHVIIVFVSRCVLIFLGLFCVAYADFSRIRDLNEDTEIENRVNTEKSVKIIWVLCLFYVFTVIKDVSFFIKLPFPRFRPFLLLLTQVGMIAICLYGLFLFEKYYCFKVALFLSMVELNYRDGKRYWKGPAKKRYSKYDKRAMKNTFIILGLLVLICLTSLTTGVFIGSVKSPGEPSLEEIFNVTYHKHDYLNPLFCQQKYSDLTLIDLATMSASVYNKDPTTVLKNLHYNPNLLNWKLGSYSLDNESKKLPSNHSNSTNEILSWSSISGVRFVEYVDKITNSSVIAIRGTNKLEDVFQDMYLWSTVGLLQTSSYFGTFFNLWPLKIAALTVYYITRLASEPNLLYVDEMGIIVKDIISSKKGKSVRDIVITGHSLGAGIAEATAARLKVQGVGFSAPGLGYSSLTFNISEEDLMKYTVNVVPLYDPVPDIDKQLGNVQYIDCYAGSNIGCHGLRRSLGWMISSCGGL